jgi:hypothetical protein
MAQTAAYFREYYQRPENRLRKVSKARERAAQNRAILQQMKLDAGCVDCGYNERYEALDFDHVRGDKRWAVSRSMNRSLPQLLDEVEKCEVRCANCHRVATADRSTP